MLMKVKEFSDAIKDSEIGVWRKRGAMSALSYGRDDKQIICITQFLLIKNQNGFN